MRSDNELNWAHGAFMAYAPIFLWIGVIFFLSSNNGSMAETSRFVGPILKFLFPNISEDTLRIVHGLVRKTAHFTEYAILAFFIIRALSASSVPALRRFRYLLPLIVVAVIAAADEFNQSFEPSRTASAWDSGLDILGGLVMTCVLWMIRRPRALDKLDSA
ncbi:MAG: VanZ family protein [Pyrinomonadaceae bacterium]